MDTFYERSEIESKYEGIIQEKFNDKFNIYKLDASREKEEAYYTNLKIFKYLFSLKEDAHIYLWNEIYNSCNYFEIDENDYSTEELKFINNVKEVVAYLRSKLGEQYDYALRPIFNINEELETDRLILKPFNVEIDREYNDFFRMNKEEYENYYECSYDEGEVIKYAHPILFHLSFAIFLKDSNEFIGSVALQHFDSETALTEYFIFPNFRRKGYAYEAVNTLITAVKNNNLYINEETIKLGVFSKVKTNISLIKASINVLNTSSIRLVEKLGFIRDDSLSKRKINDNKYNDICLYYMEIKK